MRNAVARARRPSPSRTDAARLARADRPRERPGHHPHRQPPGREHAQHPGAGFADALGRGAQLVVVDPRFSVAAGKARYWLPIKPGTDIALLLAWANVLIEERLYDADFVAQQTVGFEELKAHVKDKTPEWAWPITGIRPDLIRDSARLIGSARPASLIHPGRHTVWYGDDTQRERAMAILVALLGNWGRRGGYVLQEKMGIGPYELPTPIPHREGAQRQGRRGQGEGGTRSRPRSSRRGSATRRSRAPLFYDLKAWLVYGCNLMQALPKRSEVIEAIQHLEHLDRGGVLPAEIAGWADVVLPECTYLEREDDLWNGAVAQAVHRHPACSSRAARRLEAELVDRQGAGRQGRPRAVLPVDRRGRVREGARRGRGA